MTAANIALLGIGINFEQHLYCDTICLQMPEISDDSSAGVSPDLSPVTSPQTAWKESIFQLPPNSSVEVTPTRVCTRGRRPKCHFFGASVC